MNYDSDEDLAYMGQHTGASDDGLAAQCLRHTAAVGESIAIRGDEPVVMTSSFKLDLTAWDFSNGMLFVGAHQSVDTTSPASNEVFIASATWVSNNHGAVGLYYNTDESDSTLQLITCDGSTVTKYDTGVTPAEGIRYFTVLSYDGSVYRLRVYNASTKALLGDVSSTSSDLPTRNMVGWTGFRTLTASQDVEMRHFYYNIYKT
jgi:hypothetical protein